ncbi:MAG: leucine-rich repeat protein [Ruminococcus sp.]|nr:leucine-rich repeat protein [Ruminococcus sp.]
MTKKILSVLLAVVIMLGSFLLPPIGGFSDLTPDASANTYGDFSYRFNTNGDNTVTVTGYLGDDEVVNIPSHINGYLVNTIDSGSSDWRNAVTINIPDTVKKISSYAFFACSKLTTVHFGAGVCSIGDGAFSETQLSKFSVSSANKYLYTIDDVLFNKYNELVAYPSGKTNTHYTVPSGTTAILSWAFQNSDSLESVTIPSSVVSIGDDAFYFCRSLTTVNIADSVKRIGEGAFSYSGLTSFDFPENLTSIGNYAFESTYLTQAYIPSKVSDVGYGILTNTPITSISVSPYNNYLCTVDGVLFSKDMKILYQYPSDKVATSYKVPNGVEEIWGGAFRWADITSVSLPEGLKKIGYFAFSLSDINMDVLTIPDSVTEIAMHAFYACKIKKVYIGKRVKYIGVGAFSETLKAYFKGNGVDVFDELWGGGAFPRVLDAVSLFYPKGDPTWTSDLLVDRYNWGTWDTPVYYVSDITQANITLSKTSYEYNGKECKPSVTVKIGTKTLKEGENYTLKYADNYYPGKASVTITGINDYEGEVKKTFTINKRTWVVDASLSKNNIYVGEEAKVIFYSMGEIEYKSSNPACATIDSYGNIVAKSKGSTNITVTVLEDECFKKSSKTMKLNVVSATNKAVGLTTLTYSFGNNAKSVGYVKPCRIPKSRYKLIFDESEIQKQYDWQGDWGGSCGGMAITSMMFNTVDDDVDLSDFKSSAKYVSDLAVGNRSSQHNLTVKEFIETMQLAQGRSEVHRTNNETKNDIQGLFDRIKLTEKGGPPVYIGVSDGKGVGHALLGYKTKKISSKESRIYVYDCNYPKTEKWITVSTTSSGKCTGWYYAVNGKYPCGSAYYKYGSDLDYVPYEVFKYIWENRNSGTAARSGSVARSSMSVDGDNFEIRSESGEVLATMKDGMFISNEKEIYEVQLPRTEDASDTEHMIFMPTDEYEIVNTDKNNYELDLSMNNGDQSVDVTTVADSVELNVDDSRNTNIVDINGEGSDYEVEVRKFTSEDDSESVVYKGKCGEDEVSVGVYDDELVAKNYDNSSVVKDDQYMNFIYETSVDISNYYFIEINEYIFYTDGKRKTPEIKVTGYDGCADLIEGVDYEVVYSDNLQSGTAKVTAYGINDYKGCIEKTFRIYDRIYAPASLSATAKAGEVKLSWRKATDADGYEIQQFKDNEWVTVETAENGDIQECTIKDLSANTNYKFRIRAFISTGADVCYGKFSSEVSAKTTSAATPKITKVENVKGGAKITWNKVDGADAYRVFRKNGSSWTQVGTTIDTEYTHSISKSNSTYTYTVRCLSADEKSFVSSYNKTGVKNTYIAQPEITKFENVNGGTKITWGKVAGAAKYRLFKKTNGKWTTLATTTSTSFTHKISASNTTSTYTVRCLSSDGKKYTSGYNTTGYNNTYIAQPKITKFENVNGGTKITWGKVAGASKYRVFKKTKSGWSTIATTTANSYTYKISSSNTTNTYTVRCLSSDGKKYTSSYNKTGYAYKYIATPKLRAISNTSSGVKLTYYKVSGAPKYRVYRKTGSGSWSKIADVSNKYDYYVDKTAKKGVKYTYTVRCVSSNGKSTVSGYDSKGLAITRK